MAKYYPQPGDQIEVCTSHRFRGETGAIVAVGDNPTGEVNHFHIRFDRDVWGCIDRREIWLGFSDFLVTRKVDEGKA